jgi:hypothetical protein
MLKLSGSSARNPFTLLCCFGRFLTLGPHGSYPAPWQTPELEHPDTTEVQPGRYPHTGRVFFCGAFLLTKTLAGY